MGDNQPRKNREFQTVGLVGLGLMGRGIAACFLGHGFRLIAYEVEAVARETAREYIATAIEELVERAGFPASLRDDWRGRYVEAATYDDLAPCDFVIESVFEDLPLKLEVFDWLEEIVAPETPIASNTSAIPISKIQESRRQPERFLGMHWFSPAYVTRFMEVIKGEQTADDVYERIVALAWDLGKEPVRVRKDVRGFVINRLGYAMLREAFNLIETGVADPEAIDTAVRTVMGWWSPLMGPFRMMDLTGLAAYGAVMRDLFPELSNSREVPEKMQELMAAGRRGADSGQGFYEYTEDEAKEWRRRITEFNWEIRALTDKYAVGKQRPAQP